MNLPQMIRNLWIYRRVLALAIILGVAAAFLWRNWQPIPVSFLLFTTPDIPAGLVMMVSAALGAGATWVVLTFRHAVRSAREQQARPIESVASPPLDKSAEKKPEEPPPATTPDEAPKQPQAAGS